MFSIHCQPFNLHLYIFMITMFVNQRGYPPRIEKPSVRKSILNGHRYHLVVLTPRTFHLIDVNFELLQTLDQYYAEFRDLPCIHYFSGRVSLMYRALVLHPGGPGSILRNVKTFNIGSDCFFAKHRVVKVSHGSFGYDLRNGGLVLWQALTQ